jgi:hypothetical protein
MTLKLTNQKFGRLTVISKDPIRSLSGSVRWNCICDCGKAIIVVGNNLTSGNTNSCGCLKIEIHTTHGMANSPEYKTWAGIIQRCTNSNEEQYSDYGGRGITVCDRWLNSFEAFYRDMGPRPSPDHSIDRKENDKGYYKDNCRWATRAEQDNNKRNNVYYEYKNNQYTIPQLLELPEVKANGISIYVLSGRIRNLNWSVEQAINTLVRQQERTYTYNSITKTIGEWANEYKIDHKKLYDRLIRLGWSFEKAVNTI